MTEQYRYPVRYVAFLLAHLEVLAAAIENPDPKAGAAERERLEREYRFLPPRHSCSCSCSCISCARYRDQPYVDVGAEIGYTARAYPPMPDPVVLDIKRALATGARSALQVARVLNSGDGTERAAS